VIGQAEETAPKPVENLRAKQVSETAGMVTVQLEWAANAESDLSGYRVYRKDPAGAAGWVTATTSDLASGTTQWTDPVTFP